MYNFPRHLIFPDKVYLLTILYQSDVERAEERNLIDYRIEQENPLVQSDRFTMLLGVTKGFALGYRNSIPLEFLLARFLCDHIRTNTVRLLDGKNGEVLTYKIHRKYLGVETPEAEIHKTLFDIFHSWLVAFPQEPLSWADLFVSSISLTEGALKKGLDSFNEYIVGTKKESQMLPDSIIIGSLPEMIRG